MRPYSLRLIYHKYREQFIPILITLKEGQYNINDKLHVILSKAEIPDTKLAQYIMESGFKHTWYKLHYKREDCKTVTSVAKIKTSNNTFTVMRNGWNISAYNLAIVDHNSKEIHYRMCIREVFELINILGGDPEDLPLMISLPFCDRNKRVLEARLRT